MTGWLILDLGKNCGGELPHSRYAVWQSDPEVACHSLRKRLRLVDHRLVVLEQLSDAALRACGAEPKRIAEISATSLAIVRRLRSWSSEL